MAESKMLDNLDGLYKDFRCKKSTDDISVWRQYKADRDDDTRVTHGHGYCAGGCGEYVPYEHLGKMDVNSQKSEKPPRAYCPPCRTRMGMQAMPPHIALKCSPEQIKRWGIKEDGSY